jgi:predicted  nucleic acid-binding Zn-ribbon protein
MTDQAKALLELQRIDLEILRLRKRHEELPVKAEAEKVAAKIKEVSAKSKQVAGMKRASEDKMSEFEKEEAALDEKAAGLEAQIKDSTDYRMLNNLTRDMEGAVKRREKIEFELDALMTQLEKVGVVEAQIGEALAKLGKRKAELLEALNKQEGEIKADLLGLLGDKKDVSAEISADLLARYTKIAAARGGIGAGRLEDATCQVCGMSFPVSVAEDYRNGPEIAVCSNCQRLLVTKE